MGQAAEHVLATLGSSQLPDGAVKPIFRSLGRDCVFRPRGIGKHGPETALPVAAGEAKDKNDRGGVGSTVPWWKAAEKKEGI
eukprot:12608630-Alexandrium_andersonii.AAC.1